MNLITRLVATAPLLIASALLHADPSTAPSTQPLSLARQVARWQDEFETRTPEQMLSAYAVHNDTQARWARVMAAEGVACSKLIELAREKWGDKAEIAVAHACGTDSRADDAKANTVYVGNHATMSFNAGTISPFLLVQEDGHWLIDTQSYITLASADPAGALADTEKFLPIYQAATDKLLQGTYPSVDALVADLTKRLAAIGQ